jgi:D-alanine-D-alanine ligase
MTDSLHRTVAPWDEIASLLKKLDAISKRLAVVVVTNLKVPSDQTLNALETEYLSESELEIIILSFRRLGIFTRLFSSEDAFISAFLDGELGSIPRELVLVYNSAQTGSGPGRKALIPAFCQLHGLPTVGSNPYVVSLARHKFHVSCLLRAMGLPAPPSWSYHWQDGWLLNQRPPLGTKVILKPTYESASIGIDDSSVVTVSSGTDAIVKECSRALLQPLTVQTFIKGFEVEVPVVGLSRPFAPGAIGISLDGVRCLMDKILTFDLVYSDGYGFFSFSEVSAAKAKEIEAVAIKAFQLLGIEGFGRIDCRLDDAGCIAVTDIATNPHITAHSSFAHVFLQRGWDYSAVPGLLLALGCRKAGWI